MYMYTQCLVGIIIVCIHENVLRRLAMHPQKLDPTKISHYTVYVIDKLHTTEVITHTQGVYLA
jgi:hypothetical protein